MKNIVDEAGQIIAKTTDDHALIGGHHRLAVVASLGQKLFWKDSGEPVKLIPSSREVLIDIQLDAQGNVTQLTDGLVKAHHVDAAEFVHLMTVGWSNAIPPRVPAAPPRSPGSST